MNRLADYKCMYSNGLRRSLEIALSGLALPCPIGYRVAATEYVDVRTCYGMRRLFSLLYCGTVVEV